MAVTYVTRSDESGKFTSTKSATGLYGDRLRIRSGNKSEIEVENYPSLGLGVISHPNGQIVGLWDTDNSRLITKSQEFPIRIF